MWTGYLTVISTEAGFAHYTTYFVWLNASEGSGHNCDKRVKINNNQWEPFPSPHQIPSDENWFGGGNGSRKLLFIFLCLSYVHFPLTHSLSLTHTPSVCARRILSEFILCRNATATAHYTQNPVGAVLHTVSNLFYKFSTDNSTDQAGCVAVSWK